MVIHNSISSTVLIGCCCMNVVPLLPFLPHWKDIYAVFLCFCFFFLTITDNVEVNFLGEFLLLCGFSASRTGPVCCHACTSAALIDLAKLFCEEIAPIPMTTSWIFQQVFLSEDSNWRTEKRNTSQSKKTALRMHLMVSGTYLRLIFPSRGISPMDHLPSNIISAYWLSSGDQAFGIQSYTCKKTYSLRV